MKKHLLFFLYIAVSGFFTSCDKFLDVSPKDKVLEEDQYSTEAGVQGALNGLYRQMISNSLYGAALSQTSIEAMGHVYTYPPTQPSGTKLSLTLYYLCHGQYENSSVESIFSNVWKYGYSTLFNINFFLKSMETSSAQLGNGNKELLMGEAYGLRAYLHFDLFRLFGPIWEERTDEKILPYNRSTDVVLNHVSYEEDVYSTADEYMNYVLDDIQKAEQLTASDPILTDESAISETLSSDFYKNRNRRMNHLAIKALKARVLQYMGNYTEAAATAKEVTAYVGKVFNWDEVTDVASKANYSFFNEVVFGINSPDMASNYTSFYSKTDLNDIYAADHDNLIQNIYSGFGDNLKSIVDVRSKQWTESNDLGGSSNITYSQNGTYISNKFNTSSNSYLPAIVDFQPLIRITEMYYIQVEAALKGGDKATAAELLNLISAKRGIPDTSSYYLTETDDDSAFYSHIESEYYKEFYGEGQVFFYHKRMKSSQMFPGYGGAAESVNPSVIYHIPIPNIETDI